MIRIAEKPHDIAFSKNPIVFKINNEDNGKLLTNSGPQSILAIELPGVNLQSFNIFNDGQSLSLTVEIPYGTFSKSFTFKNQPVGEEIGLHESLEFIFNKIKSAHEIAPFIHFSIKTEQNKVFFIAESKYQGYTIHWTLSNNIQEFTITSVEPFSQTDVSITYKIYFENKFNGGDWNEVFSGAHLISNEMGYSFINISDIIDSECLLSLPENPFAHYSRTAPTITDNIRRYYLRCFEGNNTLTEQPRYALIGGSPNRIWLSAQLLQNITKDSSFLSFQPDIKRISRYGIEYITWFNYTGETQLINTFVTPYSGNNVGVAYVPEGATATVPSGLCVTIPIHPAAFQIGANVTHYEFVIRNAAGNNISSSRTIIIADLQRTRYLAYLNAFNCPEIVTCTGDMTTRITISDESWNSIRNMQSGISIVKNERILAKIEREYTYRTGYISAKQKEAYTELAISTRIFDVTTPQYFGLVLVSTKSNEITFDDSEKNYSFEWILRPILSENTFAPDATTRAISANPEPPQFPQGVGIETGISTGLKSFHITQAEFDALMLSNQLLEGIYFLTDTDPQEVWFSGGGNTAVDITYGPLRYLKIDPLSGISAVLVGISSTNAEERKRMRFFRGNAQIFIDDDFIILTNDVIQFHLPFENETFRAFY